MKVLLFFCSALFCFRLTAQLNNGPESAGAQYKLGIAYQNKNDFSNAEEAYRNAFEMYERLAMNNPSAYEPYLAEIQYRLGIIYQNNNDFAKAEEAYQGASEIYERLVKIDSYAYEPYLAEAQYKLWIIDQSKNYSANPEDILTFIYWAGWPLFIFIWLRTRRIGIVIVIVAAFFSWLIICLMMVYPDDVARYWLFFPPYFLILAYVICWKASRICKRTSDSNGSNTPGNFQVSDISQVALLRRRVVRAAFFMKVIGLMSSLVLFIHLSDFNNWVLIALAIVVFWLSFHLSGLLRTGKTFAAILIWLWVALFFAGYFFNHFRLEALKVQINEFQFFDYKNLFFYLLKMTIVYLSIYFVIVGLVTFHVYKSNVTSNPGKFEPLTLNPWEDRRNGMGKRPVFLNKSSLKAYLFLLLAPFIGFIILISYSKQFRNKILPGSVSVEPWDELYNKLSAGFLIWSVMIYLYRRGRRHAMLTGNELLKKDKRAIVLYFRAFLDDSNVTMRAWANNGRILPESFIKITFEELVTDHLWRYGPVVALGDPTTRNRLAPLGAARDFERADNWQHTAMNLMYKASMIVAVVSKTEGFLWEINTIIRLGFQSKLVLLLPPVSYQSVSERWESLVQQVTDIKLPQKIDFTHTCAVTFSGDQAVATITEKRDSWAYETALDNASELILAR